MDRPTSLPACPRCGYDQSGVAAAWGDRCAMAGVCSECGLEFWWGDVLNPALTTPAWSFEHARSHLLRRLVTTWVVAIAPWRFWRRIRMEHEIRPRRLVIFAVAMYALAHAAHGVAHGWETYLAADDVAGWMRSQGINVEAPWKTGVRAGVWSYAHRGYGGAWGASFAPPGLGRAEMMALGALLAAPLALLLLPDSFRRARIRRLHILRGGVYALAGSTAVVVCIALPQAISASNQWAPAPGPFLIWAGVAERAIALAGILWLWLYWFCFAREYLRLRPAWAIALVVLVIALLTPPAMAALILGPKRFAEWVTYTPYGF